MKKLVLLIFASLCLCGCNNAKKNEVVQDEPNVESNKQEEIPTRQDVLLEQARIMYNDSYDLIEENIGSHFTPLRSIETDIEYDYLFEGCNKNTTGIEYIIYEYDNEIISQTKLYFICDNKITIYYYNDLSEGAEPINITEKELEQ